MIKVSDKILDSKLPSFQKSIFKKLWIILIFLKKSFGKLLKNLGLSIFGKMIMVFGN